MRCFYNVSFDVNYSIYSVWSDTKAVSIYSQTNTVVSSSSSSTQDMLSSFDSATLTAALSTVKSNKNS